MPSPMYAIDTAVMIQSFANPLMRPMSTDNF
jgi:hypothetical protein